MSCRSAASFWRLTPAQLADAQFLDNAIAALRGTLITDFQQETKAICGVNTLKAFEKQTLPARAATPQVLFSGAYLQGKIFFGLRQSSEAAKDGSDAADTCNRCNAIWLLTKTHCRGRPHAPPSLCVCNCSIFAAHPVIHNMHYLA